MEIPSNFFFSLKHRQFEKRIRLIDEECRAVSSVEQVEFFNNLYRDTSFPAQNVEDAVLIDWLPQMLKNFWDRA